MLVAGRATNVPNELIGIGACVPGEHFSVVIYFEKPRRCIQRLLVVIIPNCVSIIACIIDMLSQFPYAPVKIIQKEFGDVDVASLQEQFELVPRLTHKLFVLQVSNKKQIAALIQMNQSPFDVLEIFDQCQASRVNGSNEIIDETFD